MTNKSARRKTERGVALIIAIFTMMLISVVATAVILTAGTAAAIKVNYKNSMQAFYDAKAGLEEGRSRLWGGNPNCLVSSTCTVNPPTGNPCVATPMPTNQVCYITNPDAAAGETSMDPTNASDPYYDTEYNTEFGVGTLAGANVTQVASNSPLASPNIAGPTYKWVRITARTGQSAGINVDGSAGSNTNPLYYCVPVVPLAASSGNCQDTQPHQFAYTGVGAPTDGTTQVLTVTALAVTPGGGFSGRRLLQYTVAQTPDPLGQALTNGGATPSLTQILPAALTLDGIDVSYSGSVTVNGNDGAGPSGSGVPAIAYTDGSDPSPSCSCQSPTGIQPVQNITLPNAMQTPAGLDALVQAITQEADAVITPPTGGSANQGNLPSAMSPTNPMIVVVNGDFHLTHSGGTNNGFTGYGLLVVTGTFYYDPDDSWNGIILVIGKGVFNGSQNGHNGQINGAILVAKTNDSNGNPLTTLGSASFNLTGGGNGIHYNSSLVKSTQSLVPYQVLSFREIQLTQ